MTTLYAFGLGIATANSQGNLLDTFYPYPISMWRGIVLPCYEIFRVV